MKSASFSIIAVLLLVSTAYFSVVNAAESALPKQENQAGVCSVLRAQLCAAAHPNTCAVVPVDCGSMQPRPFAPSAEAGRQATFFYAALAIFAAALLVVLRVRQYAAFSPSLAVFVQSCIFAASPEPLLANGLSSFRF